MSREAEQSMRCSELRAHQLTLCHSRPLPRQQAAQVEVWRERGEGEAEALYAKSCQAEGAEEVARQLPPRPRPGARKTAAALRVKVQMVCQSLSRKSCHTRCGSRLHMTHAGCRQCAQMGSSRAS